MKMVAGLTKPTSGEMLYKGHAWNYRDKASIAYMSTEPFFYDFMTVETVGEYYDDFFDDFDMEKYLKLIERVGLEWDMKIKALSTGMQAKLKVVVTLARKASLYLLDEPLNGIDYKAREEIISIILEEAVDNNCFVISTHLIDEVETFVDEAVFVKDGKIIYQIELSKHCVWRSRKVIYQKIFTEKLCRRSLNHGKNHQI